MSPKRQPRQVAKPKRAVPAKPKPDWRDDRSFGIEVALSTTSTLDPFALPASPDALFAAFNTLESQQPLFTPPDPLAYGGEHSHDWHRFLRGPLQPFMATLGLVYPVSPETVPNWAVQAVNRFLRQVKCDGSRSPAYATGWCIGFGIEAADQLQQWEVKFAKFAKLPTALKHHLFIRAADATENHIETSRAFMNGFCDGVTAGQQIKFQSMQTQRCLQIALKWPTFMGLSRTAVVKLLGSPDEQRQILQLLRQLGFPRH